MKKISLLFFLFIFCCGFSFAQNPLVKQWDHRYGGSRNEWLSGIIQTSDNGYLLAGYTDSDSSGDKTQNNWKSGPYIYDYWIIKTDSLGIKQWDKRFGGNNNDLLMSFQQTTDGGYILGGSSLSGANGDKTQSNWSSNDEDFWVVKIDSLGKKQWDRRYGGIIKEHLNSLQQTKDGGYILAGTSTSDVSGDKTQSNWGTSSINYWIVKIDSSGYKKWDKRFGGVSVDVLEHIEQTNDGGYIMGGYSLDSISGDKTENLRDTFQTLWGDYWIVKTDSLGNKQWDKRFGGNDEDIFYSLRQTPDGGYILFGSSKSDSCGDKTKRSIRDTANYKPTYDYWIVKVDSLGNKQWDKIYGGEGGDEDTFIGNILLTSSHGYILCCTSDSYKSGDKSENNLGYNQTWIVCIDSVGNKLWDKTVMSNNAENSAAAIIDKRGCLTIANTSFSGIGGEKTEASRGGGDFWMIKYCECNQSTTPTANFISSDTVFCNEPAKCISFTDLSSCNATSWKWHFTGASPDTSTQQNPTNICYPNSGTYPVTLIVTNSSGSDTLTVSPMIVVGGPLPPVIIIKGGDTLMSSHGSSYQWYFNGNSIAGATDSFYIWHQGGLYSVQITDGNGCKSISAGVPLSVNELTSGSRQLVVYPNPVEEEFNVSGFSIGVRTTLEVYNIFGEKVYSAQIEGGNKKQETINCKQFSPGIYFVKVANEKMNWVGKFVKE